MTSRLQTRTRQFEGYMNSDHVFSPESLCDLSFLAKTVVLLPSYKQKNTWQKDAKATTVKKST